MKKKEVSHEISDFTVFFMNQFPPGPRESHTGIFENFSENSRRYSQLLCLSPVHLSPCHWNWWLNIVPVFFYRWCNSSPLITMPAIIVRQCVDVLTRWLTFSYEYLRKLSYKFKMAPIGGYLGAYGKLIHENFLKLKVLCQASFKFVF